MSLTHRRTRFHAAWRGWFIGISVHVFWLSAWFLAASGSSAWAQPNTLQAPASPRHDQPAKTPSVAPNVPVQNPGLAKSEKPPVVPPRGQVHPHKPPATAAKILPPVQPQTPASPSADAPVEPRPPEKLPDPEKPEGTPAKLPRFASLRSDDVNMRAGPGTRYRIDWVYRRRDLPVEIEREFDVWRWVRDADGIQGWIHQATLMGRRSFIVEKVDATLRSDPSDSASAVAILKPGVIGHIRSCEAASDWCNVQTGSYRGYLRRGQVWGLLAGEAINP